MIRLVVASTQNAFIRRRKITDSILIADGCINMRRKVREEGLVCKLDLENVYDRVDWDFLF